MEPGAPNLGGEAFDLLKHLRERDEATLTLRRDLFAEHCKPKDRPVKHTNVAALLTYWSEDQCDFDVTPEVCRPDVLAAYWTMHPADKVLRNFRSSYFGRPLLSTTVAL